MKCPKCGETQKNGLRGDLLYPQSYEFECICGWKLSYSDRKDPFVKPTQKEVDAAFINATIQTLPREHIEEGVIVGLTDLSKADIVFGKDILKICYNGDIFYKGRKIVTDQELVLALREFVAGTRKIE